VLFVDPDAGTLEYASYGETRQLCAEAKKVADAAYNAIMRHYREDV
jgi:hypothetical protein